MRRLFVVGLVLVVGVGPSPARASEEAKNAEEVSLPPTLITEGATPATELEATFTMAKSEAERGYGFGFSSIQYAPIPSFGLKLIVPFAVRDPRDSEPTVAGIGDVSVMAKYAPVLLPAQQFALSGGLTVTFPTGSERRELGGQFAVAPFLAAGKGLGAWSLQADVAYRWQLNDPRELEPEEEGGEPGRRTGASSSPSPEASSRAHHAPRAARDAGAHRGCALPAPGRADARRPGVGETR